MGIGSASDVYLASPFRRISCIPVSSAAVSSQPPTPPLTAARRRRGNPLIGLDSAMSCRFCCGRPEPGSTAVGRAVRGACSRSDVPVSRHCSIRAGRGGITECAPQRRSPGPGRAGGQVSTPPPDVKSRVVPDHISVGNIV